MPKYLFTSDQRISVLPERIRWVADFINSGHNISEIDDKSDNNNATTLKFYYNLHSGTETCRQSVDNPRFAIRNFILKFQFPNVRTQESLQKTIEERLFLAPYRSVISLLIALMDINGESESTMSLVEILYFIFCNPSVYKNPSVNYKEVAYQIYESRHKNINYETNISTLIEWNQYKRQARELIYVLTYASNCFSFSNGIIKLSKSHSDYELDKDFINEIINYNKFWYPSDINNFNLAIQEYISYMNTVNTPYSIIEFTPNSNNDKKEVEPQNYQQIFYGAPGTGKSHIINKQIEGENVIRTTFHPDSDYSTFVGAYKPTTKTVPLRDMNGHIIKELNEDSKIMEVVTEDRIVYEFVSQAFLQAYIQAWKFYSENEKSPKKQYLIIEEINRGNCAQIFGDLFQLLDRNQWGFSDYPINADKDMKKQLSKAFKQFSINDASTINAYYKGRDVIKEVLSGDILLLPNNLFIWATMNTSDQSLFPIDSAFKRRWDWQYMPIAPGRDEEGNELRWTIEVDNKEYSWWSFIEKINAQIGEATQSEDKKLGFFFCKAKNGVILPETFVSKVVFYLWNDVFKDYGFEGSIFRDTDNSELSFNKFYNTDSKGIAIVQNDKVALFLDNLGVELIEVKDEGPEEDEDGNNLSSSTTTGRNYDKFSINGAGRYAKNNLAAECVKKYIELNPDITAEEVINNWKSFKNLVPHFMESKEEFDARTDNSKRSHEIQCNGSVLYVAHNGYGSNGKAQILMDAVNQKNWGLTIERHNA